MRCRAESKEREHVPFNYLYGPSNSQRTRELHHSHSILRSKDVFYIIFVISGRFFFYLLFILAS